jgi:hypothetical protein
MPAKHRPAIRTRATVYRTYRLTPQLRKGMAEKRKQYGLTVAEFVAEAIKRELHGITHELARACLAFGESKDSRPARLPLTDELIATLKSASRTTGVPASKILIACINRAANRKRRRP